MQGGRSILTEIDDLSQIITHEQELVLKSMSGCFSVLRITRLHRIHSKRSVFVAVLGPIGFDFESIGSFTINGFRTNERNPCHFRNCQCRICQTRKPFPVHISNADALPSASMPAPPSGRCSCEEHSDRNYFPSCLRFERKHKHMNDLH
jgi:hypothetical protein